MSTPTTDCRRSDRPAVRRGVRRFRYRSPSPGARPVTSLPRDNRGRYLTLDSADDYINGTVEFLAGFTNDYASSSRAETG